jgi:hypothetical protein
MRADDITQALGDVGGKWTRQIKAEEKRPSARQHRPTMYTVSRISLKEICFDHMEGAWNKASGGGRLPTHWRQIFYVMRPICDDHPESDRPLLDTNFKQILEDYLEERRPGWDVLRGARGVFKEPYAALNDTGLAMSTMNVRNYLGAPAPSAAVNNVPARFPTKGATNRIAAVLICEKEGFDELLEAEKVPARFDLALMSTKGISAIAARDLARSLGVPCFTLHDLDKNGFVMAGGFPFATRLGLRMEDVEKWALAPEDQIHRNPEKARRNLLKNGAMDEEAKFISQGSRVELNMFTGEQFIEFVEGRLKEHGVEKVIPDEKTLRVAWRRAHLVRRVNHLIDRVDVEEDEAGEIDELEDETEPLEVDLEDAVPPMPDDLADRIREEFKRNRAQSWDAVLSHIVTNVAEDAA